MKCGAEKPLSCFYKHPQMADGHVNKCKDCNKKDVTDNRNKKIEYYRQYDRERDTPERQLRRGNERRSVEPLKYKARTAVGNALRDGRLFRQPCEVCGSEVDVHGHHDDYSKPLTVRWLCQPHHQEWHNNVTEL